MNELVEMIDDLRELHTLYSTGEIRSVDFQTKLTKYTHALEQFEREIEQHFEASHADG